MESKPTFWTTLPGILTGLAALLTAMAGVYSVVQDDLPWRNGKETVTGPTEPDTRDTGKGAVTGIAVPDGDTPHPPPDDGATALKPLVDCRLAPYRLENTLRSLMSWSDNYHDQIVAAGGSGGQLLYACQQAISYRGSAHCQAPRDTAIRQALFETLSLCHDKGVDTGALFEK